MSKIFISIVVLFFIIGCSTKEAKPFEKYTVFDNSKVEKRKQTDKVLKISKIKSPKYTQSNKIWYKKSSVIIDSYVYSTWNSSFNDMIEHNLVNTISKSALYKTTYVRYSKVRADLVLESEIVSAVQNIDNNSVVFGIRLYLIDQRSSELLSSQEFDYEEKCEIKDAQGAVKAYEKIIKKLNKDVILWLNKSVKEN